VPTCPISLVSSSSLLPRRFDGGFMNVRLVCTLNCRVPGIGMSDASGCPKSIISPVLMSCAARSTVAGFMWLPAPRSSPAPHLDGHRWDSVGGRQL
jgi:hypothetical protein